MTDPQAVPEFVDDDVRILRETVASVLRREGISADGHATRPEFSGSAPRQAALVGAERHRTT